MDDNQDREVLTEWRVDSEATEDCFGTDEAAAREWLEYCKRKPNWLPVTLSSRTVVTERSAWVEVN